MSNRAKHFEALQGIRTQINLIIQRNERFGKHNIFVGQFIAGLKKAQKSISNLVSYSADDKKYLFYVGDAAVKINILCNRLLKGKLKEEALALYEKCCAILPADFQLNLFMVGKEFGWDINVKDLDKPTSKAFKSVQQFVAYWKEAMQAQMTSRYELAIAQFRELWKTLQGKQLSFADCGLQSVGGI